jgi:hypothetical protein
MSRDLKWEEYKRFWYDGMVAIYTIPDGSCLLHAVLNAFWKPYRENRLGMPYTTYMRKVFRPELARLLSSKIPLDEKSPGGETIYNQLGQGEIAKLGSTFSLPSLQRELLSGGSLDGDCFFEFLIKVIGKNIYVLSETHKDVCDTGSASRNVEIPDAPCIVLLHLPGHYELIGLKDEDGVHTLFTYNHPFIKAIRERLSRVKTHKESRRA